MTVSQRSTVEISAPEKFVMDTTVARALAVLLIINSHAEALYPYSWMADGGQLGISIFFFVAGLGTALSGRTASLSFVRWYMLRLTRLYPSIWIVVGLFSILIFQSYSQWTLNEYFRRLVYPVAGYTFFGSIIVFYAVGYYLVRYLSVANLGLALAVSILVSGTAMLPDAIALYPDKPLQLGRLNWFVWWPLYFTIYLMGVWVGARRPAPVRRTGMAWAGLGVLSIAYVSLKFMMVVHASFAYLFPLLWAVVIAWVLILVECCRGESFNRQLRRLPVVGPLIVLVGALSLETFLVHVQLLKFDWLRQVMFPINIFLLIAMTVVISWPIYLLAGRVQRRLTKWIERA